jgi:hypothetical protein
MRSGNGATQTARLTASGAGFAAGKVLSARCPVHADQRASLSNAVGADGPALVKCHAGCKADAISAAVGLREVDLMPTADMVPTLSKSRGTTKVNGKAHIMPKYGYRNKHSICCSKVCASSRRISANGSWKLSVKGVRTVPYQLPEILPEPTRPVAIVEGEKNVDAMARIGALPTGKWSAAHVEFLRGRPVVVLPDDD